MDRKLFAWLLVVVFLVCSYAAPAVCSSRPLASDGDAREDVGRAAAAGSGSCGNSAGGQREVWSRRSLGYRSPWSPPSPLWNGATTMPVPPPPWA